MRARITVIAHKGGAGKTTVTANLGAALAMQGQRVLLVDCDPQGALAATLGVPAEKPTLYEVLTEAVPTEAAVRPATIERLAVLPADLNLTSAEDDLFGRPRWHLILRERLAPLDGYDLVLLDTPPGLGVLSFLALQASTDALIVCPPEFLAYRALGQVLGTITRAREITPELRVLGILPTLVTRRSRHERDVLDDLQREHGDLLLPEVPRRVALQDAARSGRPVVVSAPHGDAAAVFHGLARAVLDRLPAPLTGSPPRRAGGRS